MAENFRELNKKINEMAVELVAQDPCEVNNPLVKKLQDGISSILVGIYVKDKEKTDEQGKAYDISTETYDVYGNPERFFALVGKKIPHDVFWDALSKLLGRKKDGTWLYDPQKATFVTAFKFKLEKELLNYHENNKEKSLINSKKIISLDEESKNKKGLPFYGGIADKDAHITFDNVLNKMIAFDYVMGKYESLSLVHSEKEANYFKGFFTFDVTKALKLNRDLGKVASKHNKTLFPLLLITLLEHIMTGAFLSIKDILANSLRPGLDLEKRGELLENFFKISHPTQVKYSKKYDRIKRAVLGEIL